MVRRNASFSSTIMLALTMLLSAACGDDSTQTAEWFSEPFGEGRLVFRVTEDRSGGSMTASLSGAVEIGEHGCLQVDEGDEAGSIDPVLVVGTADAEIDGDVLRFRDGSTLRVGDTVRLSGGYLDHAPIEACEGARIAFVFSTTR